MAITKKRKNEMVSQYVEWLSKSQALIMAEYKGLNMKTIDDLRARTRETGGEFHIIKNTLGKVAFRDAGLKVPDELLEGSTAVVFAFRDAPATAKMLTDFARTSDFVKIKGGVLEKRAISSSDVKALADLPPLPVVRAQLLGVLNAPASKLVRTLAEPGRSLAAVIKAHADKEGGEPATA